MESHLNMSVRGIIVLPNTHPSIASMSILIIATNLQHHLCLVSPVDSTVRLLLVLLALRLFLLLKALLLFKQLMALLQKVLCYLLLKFLGLLPLLLPVCNSLTYQATSHPGSMHGPSLFTMLLVEKVSPSKILLNGVSSSRTI